MEKLTIVFHRKMKLTMFLVILLNHAATCQEGTLSDKKKYQVTTPSGLIYEIIKPGKGEGEAVTKGQEVVFHEKMGYMDGTILYASRKSGAPIRLLIGGNQAIAGVDEGIQGMKTGEIRKLIVPPALSKKTEYPSYLSPDSTLLYEIELLEIIPAFEFPSLSPKASIVQQVGFTTIGIDYERPAARGRKIFGELVPPGKVWRTGAGHCTTIGFSEAVVINDQTVEAGVYSLFTIPDEKNWTVILNTDTSLYGAGRYDQNKDVLRFKVTAEHSQRYYESFTMDIDVVPNNADVYLSWENIQLHFRVTTSTDEKVISFIDKELMTGKSQDPDIYATAASYYYFANKEPEKALLLISKAIKKNGESWCYRVKIDILERLNRKAEAIEVAKAGIKYIKENGNRIGWNKATQEQSIKNFESRIKSLASSN